MDTGSSESVRLCKKCIVPENYRSITLNQDGVCSRCETYKPHHVTKGDAPSIHTEAPQVFVFDQGHTGTQLSGSNCSGHAACSSSTSSRRSPGSMWTTNSMRPSAGTVIGTWLPQPPAYTLVTWTGTGSG